MVKRIVKKYRKEYEELISKYADIMHGHTSRVFINFLNDVSKLNNKEEYVGLVESGELEEKE